MTRKVILFVICVLTLNLTVWAQTNIDVSFNRTHTGWSYRGGVSFYVAKNLYLGGGIKYIQWAGITDNKSYVLQYRFKPANTLEHLGAYATLDYNLFPKRSKYIQPYISYDVSVSRSSLSNLFYLYITQAVLLSTNDTIDLYQIVKDSFKPVIGVEQHFAVGFRAKISERLSLTQKIGGGLFLYTPIERIIGEEWWELAWMFNIGLSYRLGKKAPSAP